MVDDLILLVSDDDCDLIHARHRQNFQLMVKDSLITGCDQTFGRSPQADRILVPCPAAKITAFILPPSGLHSIGSVVMVFIVLNADVIFDPTILCMAVRTDSPILMIVDPLWRDDMMKVNYRGRPRDRNEQEDLKRRL